MMCDSGNDSSECSDYEDSCSGICCPEYDYTLDCGCCPCKRIQLPWNFVPVHSITKRPLITILTDEMRREMYSNMIDMTPWTSRYMRPDHAESTSNSPTSMYPIRKPKKKVPTTKKDSKPKIGQKMKKRTQSERTKARQMRKREDKLIEIANKEFTPAPAKNATKPSQLNTITVEPRPTEPNKQIQKKRPKTHFRKTKKPGRA